MLTQIILSSCLSLVQPQESLRAAVDFGSGAVKILVAPAEMGEPLLATYRPLNLKEDLAINGGEISERTAEVALSILREFKEQATLAAKGRGIQYSGIATAVFREARNGRELLDRFTRELGIPFKILPQEEEGKLGFLTAKALQPDVAIDQLIAWDSGNGSFQMTAEAQVYMGPFGHGTVRLMLDDANNPISKEEAEALTVLIQEKIPDIPEWLSEKLRSEETVVATFGDGESIFALASEALQQDVIALADVQRLVEDLIDKDDEFFDQQGLHRKTVTSAIHLAAVMEYMGIGTIHYKRSIGTTPGMLLYPPLW